MVSSPNPDCMRRRRRLTPALLLALVSLPMAAQMPLTLEEVNARNRDANFEPTHLNQKVRVTGVVNAPPFHFPAYSLLAIEAGGYGAVLRVADQDTLDAFAPGDE